MLLENILLSLTVKRTFLPTAELHSAWTSALWTPGKHKVRSWVPHTKILEDQLKGAALPKAMSSSLGLHPVTMRARPSCYNSEGPLQLKLIRVVTGPASQVMCSLCPVLHLPCSFHWCDTQEHSLIHTLQANLHLKVCFLGRPTCSKLTVSHVQNQLLDRSIFKEK